MLVFGEKNEGREAKICYSELKLFKYGLGKSIQTYIAEIV